MCAFHFGVKCSLALALFNVLRQEDKFGDCLNHGETMLANLADCKRKAASILRKHGSLKAAAQGMAGISESGLPRLLLDAPVIDCSVFSSRNTVETILKYIMFCKLGGGFKYFLFSPLPGEMIQFD